MGGKMLSRRDFLKVSALFGAGLFLTVRNGAERKVYAMPLPAGMNIQDPNAIPKYLTPLVIPPAMPRTRKLKAKGGKNIDYYEIAVRQFQQQILPAGMPPTTVWSYGSVNHPGTFNYPAFTIEAKWNAPARVKWINQLVADPLAPAGTSPALPHLLSVDQTLHWANPPGGAAMRDMRGMEPTPYTGPVPIVTHVHGAHTTDESDGYAEAWFLPDASNIPAGYATEGSWYATFKSEFLLEKGVAWAKGSSTFQYPNDQDASTLWYHDHTLGMTRLNVYAGPAGFYILRGGPGDAVLGVLPGPAPAQGDLPGTLYYEIPLAIQDRSFNADGSLFYPDNRAFFEGLDPAQLQIPFIPDTACDGQPSDISPIWNPEFFGNTMLVNGNTWPSLAVEPRRYRFRLLNGCNSRFVILKLVSGDPGLRPAAAALPFWQIGAEGGFLPAPVMLDQLLMSPAERADVIVDFTGLPAGTEIFMVNEGPDEPFGGGIAGVDFPYADPATTGQVMRFVVGPLSGADQSTPPAQLVLPARVPLGLPSVTRQVSLNEEDSKTVRVVDDGAGNIVLACDDPAAAPFGPSEALLGVMHTMGMDSMPMPMMWAEPISENPALGTTEVWEIFNYTMDAHPIHIHEVMFEVFDRQTFDMMTGMPTGAVRLPEVWETGVKDTVIAYPGEITRVKARFDLQGLYVWHCHIVEHEDNEMMRPYSVGTPPTRLP
jgi:bilirubin oxidase